MARTRLVVENDADPDGTPHWKYRVHPADSWSGESFPTKQDAEIARAHAMTDEDVEIEQEEIEAERVREHETHLVAVYEEDRAFGGPEEGGWWYDTGRLQRVVAVVKGDERAYALARRVNRLLAHRRETYGSELYGRSIDSVAYEGGHLSAHVFPRTAPESFPEQRPFYS